MIVLIKYSQKGNKMSDNWLDEYKEGLFSGRIPMRNPNIKKPGDPEYYYYDPRGMDKNAPLKDWKLIGVPTADTPNPALAEMDTQRKQEQKYSDNFLSGNASIEEKDQNKKGNLDIENRFALNELPKLGMKKDYSCVTIDDLYESEYKNGKLIYKGTADHEGGFSARQNDLGGKTNFGITQSSLNEYNNWQSPLKKQDVFPTDVKYLKQNQAKQILDEMYLRRYNIDKLCKISLARHMLDQQMSIGTIPVSFLIDEVNKMEGTSFDKNRKTIPYALAEVLNQMDDEKIIELNNRLACRRMEKYFNSVDKWNKNINGWYDRARSYYSDKDEFDRLFLKKRDEYLAKYKSYYNGK